MTNHWLLNFKLLCTQVPLSASPCETRESERTSLDSLESYFKAENLLYWTSFQLPALALLLNLERFLFAHFLADSTLHLTSCALISADSQYGYRLVGGLNISGISKKKSHIWAQLVKWRVGSAKKCPKRNALDCSLTTNRVLLGEVGSSKRLSLPVIDISSGVCMGFRILGQCFWVIRIFSCIKCMHILSILYFEHILRSLRIVYPSMTM